MDYISSFFGYFYGNMETGEDTKDIETKDIETKNIEIKITEDDDICNIQPTLTPNSMAPLPDNKYIIQKKLKFSK